MSAHCHPRARCAAQQGFTLIETIITMVTLAIVLTGLFVVHDNVMKDLNLPKEQLQTQFLAEEKLEQINHDRGSSSADFDAWVAAANYPDETPMTAPFAQFNRSVTLTDDTDGFCGGAATDGKLATVSVSNAATGSVITALSLRFCR
ncbi:type IV pilus modification PilV family protein [Magnetofaba australis]|uniref:Putative type IV pilus modification protein PilV n=1 Tax=Magnetofaba australis IT-1 TaxID=1434232 RepID=A0A1Y2K0Z5_9PROT|nr:prepilin-type N-terminal cleavage/methylation domain-containing protein [Magnetofaba australis]OSM01701.1 putative type IV pilus modification protein PilV [Magnetofaba australis IT-1]